MTKMNLPGFTAEASLYRSSAHYQVGAMLAGFRQEGGIVPSMQECGWNPVWNPLYLNPGGDVYCCRDESGRLGCCVTRPDPDHHPFVWYSECWNARGLSGSLG
jgi:hypothetical protein